MMCEQVPSGKLNARDACVYLDRGAKPQIIAPADGTSAVKANHCERRIAVESREGTALIGGKNAKFGDPEIQRFVRPFYFASIIELNYT